MSLDVITFNGNSLDLSIAESSLEDNNTHSGHILIQINGSLTKDSKKTLAEMMVEVEEKFNNCYLAKYPVAKGLEELRRLPIITRALDYDPSLVVEGRLRERDEGAKEVSVDVKLFSDTKLTSEMAHELVRAAGLDPESKLPPTGEDTTRITVKHEVLRKLARLDFVKVIHEVHPDVEHNHVAREILCSGNLVLAANRPAYDGEGQVVCVADTGFDRGSAESTDVHDAFKDGEKSRVLKLYSIGRRNDSSDQSGHGTHVCGSVLGNGIISDSTRVQGTAPKAKLVVQALGNGFGRLSVPPSLTGLFSTPYNDHEARIHTNSWGPAPNPWRQLGYSSRSRDIDTFVHKHRDMVVLFAAGNDGVQAHIRGDDQRGQIMADAASKNCITVGASENNRGDIDKTYRTFSDQFREAVANDRIANAPHGVAAFSSRGPTLEGRIKPDVVAPGTCILSTKSRCMERMGAIPSPDDGYTYMSGTSMATPLVAGCCAVLREALTRGGTFEPRAALIKALLINGAVEVRGQYQPTEAGPSPNNGSGWGRVDITRSMSIPGDPSNPEDGIKVTQDGSGGFRDESSNRALDTGEESYFDINVAAPGKTLKVTLVWTDHTGERLQNDLDLIVKLPNGEKRLGNRGANVADGDHDRVNNVEQVECHVDEGTARVIVKAHEIITMEAQKFALVWQLYPGNNPA